MKITDLMAELERIKTEHGNLTVAEELPLGLMAIQHVEAKPVPQHRAVQGVVDGETVVLVRAQ